MSPDRQDFSSSKLDDNLTIMIAPYGQELQGAGVVDDILTELDFDALGKKIQEKAASFFKSFHDTQKDLNPSKLVLSFSLGFEGSGKFVILSAKGHAQINITAEWVKKE